MRFNAVPWVAVGASLVLFQAVEAVPIRLTIVAHQEFVSTTTTTQGGGLPAIFRFGHAMGGNMQAMPNPLKRPGCTMHKNMASGGDNGMGRLTLSATLRQALGLEPIAEHNKANSRDPEPMVLEDAVVDTTATIWKAHPHTHHININQPPVDTEDSFIHRIHSALTNLEAWEARAVAFVLGCGIGVLLRMLWIFAILIIRGVREDTGSEDDYTLFIAQVAEPTTLPKYEDDAAAPVYVDEKAVPPFGA